MGNFVPLNTLDDQASHIGLSYLRARVRRIKNSKLVVDVWEYTEHRTSKARALAFARESVQAYAISSVDHTLLLDHEIERKVSDSSGIQHAIRIRQSSFAFQEAV